ncbi:MAG: hypothetical protein ACWGSQ_12155, partial [Longimicrobiales bacterium]
MSHVHGRGRHPLLRSAWVRVPIVALLFAPCPGLGLSVPHPLAAQEASPRELKPLTLEDYGRWSRISDVAISPDGRWMTYAYAPNEGDTRLFVRDLDHLERAPADTAVNGSGPVFSPDSRWLGLVTTPPEEEADRLREGRQPVPRTLHLLELANGEWVEMENVASFSFSEDSRWLAVQKPRAGGGGGGGGAAPARGGSGGGARGGGSSGGDEARGADLILRDLSDGTTRNLGNVAEHAFNEAGTHLAYVVDAEGKAGNGLYLMELAGGRILPLGTGDFLYQGMAWNEDGTALAVLRGVQPDGMEQRENVLLAFPNALSSGAGSLPAPVVFDPAAAAGFPSGFVVSEYFTPQWSADGARVFVGIKEQLETVEESDEPRANVDVWHWRDVREQSVQMIQAARDRRATDLAAVSLDDLRFVRLADENVTRVQLTDDGGWAVGFDDSPYRLD